MVRQRGCRQSQLSKRETPRRASEAPTLPGGSHSSVTPQYSQSISHYVSPPRVPTPVPELTLSHKNKSPSSLPFVQTSPQSWHTVPSTDAAASPLPEWGPLQGRSGWRKGLHFTCALVPPPTQQPGSQGTGAPTAAALDDLTLLPTWIPLGLERALILRQLVLGMLAPQLPRLELRFPTFQSSEAEDNGESWYPTEGWQGLPGSPRPPPPRQTKSSGILFPLSCLWLEAAIPTIPVSSRGSHQASPSTGADAAQATSSIEAESHAPPHFPGHKGQV